MKNCSYMYEISVIYSRNKLYCMPKIWIFQRYSEDKPEKCLRFASVWSHFLENMIKTSIHHIFFNAFNDRSYRCWYLYGKAGRWTSLVGN